MLVRDLRYALRSLWKRPGFTAAILIILALGIGATTAIYSVTDAIVLRPLPYPEADRLVFFYSLMLGQEADISSVAYEDWLEWTQQSRSFDVIAASASWMRLNMTGGDLPERIQVHFVSPSYFELMGARVALGRPFAAEDNRTPPGAPVAILSHSFWQRRFGAEPDILGKTLTLNGQNISIVGVLSESFQDLSPRTEVFLPLTSVVPLMGDPSYLEDRPNRWLHPVARLRPGVSLEQAQREMEVIARGIAERNPDDNGNIGVRVMPLSEVIFNTLNLRTSTLALMAAAVLLLLICCINVTNLLILRSTERRREIAIRLALGSSNLGLMRQLMIESMLLALGGGALGILLGYWSTHSLVHFGDLELPTFATIQVNGRVVLVSFLVAILTGLAFSLLLALSLRRMDLRDSLQQVRGPGAGRAFGRKLLIVTEVALALVLLVNAGLIIRSFYLLHNDNVGVEGENLLTLRITLPPESYGSREAIRVFGQNLEERAGALPGVRKAGIWGPGIPGISANFGIDLVPDVPRRFSGDRESLYVRRHHVTPGALKELGIPIKKGREFTARDMEDRVAVISETLARDFWPGQDPLGRRLRPASAPNSWYTVIGIAADVRHGGRIWESQQPFRRDVYISNLQVPTDEITLWARTEQGANLAPSLREIVRSIDPNLPVYDVATIAERRHDEEAQFRFRAIMVALFAIVAVVLTSIGIYSVLAYAVSQRSQEIGLRAALGAQRGDVMGLFLKQGLLLVAVGLAVGLAGAVALRRGVASLLYGIAPDDPATLLTISVGLVLVALVAIYVPARKALKVDPLVALRYE